MRQSHIPAELRKQVYDRASQRCEYCLAPESLCFHSHHVDHIIAIKHGGETSADNLALSCIACNQHKGSDIASLDPEDRMLTALFHPRFQKWSDHFILDRHFIVPLTSIGRTTSRLLQLNTPDRVVEREWFAKAGELIVPVPH